MPQQLPYTVEDAAPPLAVSHAQPYVVEDATPPVPQPRRLASAKVGPGPSGQGGTTTLSGPPPLDPRLMRYGAGALGAAAATAAAGPTFGTSLTTPIIGGILRALPAVAGAATGGALTGGTEGAVEQGATEAGGQLVSWPIRAVIKRFIGSGIAEAAQKGVTSAQESAIDQFKTAVQQTTGRPIPSPVQAGTQAIRTIQGPAQSTLDRLGQAVETAAQSGPDVDWRGVKDAVGQMATKMRPVAAHAPSPAEQAVGASGVSPEVRAARLKAFQDAGIPLSEQHPLPGVLGQIQDAPDTVTFEDAHKYKRMLDDAINWDRTARNQIQGATKATRGEIRSAMSGHQPYDDATAAYQATVPLFRKGYAPQITRSALDKPEKLVNTITGRDPTPVNMLHELLTTQAGASGGAAQGQQAWNSVRSAWTYKKLIQPGLERFEPTVSKLDPDFVKTMYGDREGQLVLGNLRQISAAYQDALAKEARLSKSSLMTRAETPLQTGTDIAYLGLHATTGIHGPFMAARAAKFALHGPEMNDLVQWSTYSSKGTQLLVQALRSPVPGMALANLYRGMVGSLDDDTAPPPMMPSHGGPPTVTSAPPAR